MSNKIFIPGISGSDLKLLDQLLTNVFQNISIIIFLVAWRAQLASTLSSLLNTAEIQQLESSKLISRMIFSLGKPLAAAISVVRTLGYEAVALKEKATPAERQSYLVSIVENLVENDAPTGSAILKPAQLNPETITKHRYGIMSSIIGKWQSKPIFEPGSVISGMPPGTVNLEDVFGIGKEFFQTIFPSKASEWPTFEIFKTQIVELITGALGGTTTFNDGVYISSSNILPLEEELGLTRSAPTNYSSVELDPEENDDLLKTAVTQLNTLATSSNKRKTGGKGQQANNSKTPDQTGKPAVSVKTRAVRTPRTPANKSGTGK